jgi:hypothetical protein
MEVSKRSNGQGINNNIFLNFIILQNAICQNAVRLNNF